jgi:hypothetical protein
MITVTEIEKNVYQQFQQAAFQKYQQSVLTYGSRLWREARSVAHQRDPDANVVEITTLDVEAATVRIEMKLARLRVSVHPDERAMRQGVWVGRARQARAARKGRPRPAVLLHMRPSDSRGRCGVVA